MFSCVFRNTIIVKTIRSWKPLSREFTYKVISTVNIVHTYFSFLTLYVHSHLLQRILSLWILINLFLLVSLPLCCHISRLLIVVSGVRSCCLPLSLPLSTVFTPSGFHSHYQLIALSFHTSRQIKDAVSRVQLEFLSRLLASLSLMSKYDFILS